MFRLNSKIFSFETKKKEGHCITIVESFRTVKTVLNFTKS